MSQFTEGNWGVVDNGHYLDITTDGNEFSDKVITTVLYEKKKNAQLLAKSKAMYEKLEQCADYIYELELLNHDRKGPGYFEDPEIVKSIEKLLEEARGQYGNFRAIKKDIG